jgi:hypothetical protein
VDMCEGDLLAERGRRGPEAELHHVAGVEVLRRLVRRGPVGGEVSALTRTSRCVSLARRGTG